MLFETLILRSPLSAIPTPAQCQARHDHNAIESHSLATEKQSWRDFDENASNGPKNWRAIALVAVAAKLALVLVLGEQPTFSNMGNFNHNVKDGINRTSPSLDKDIPMDNYINGIKDFTFSFKEKSLASLPAGRYFIEMKPATTNITVMKLGSTDIPKGVEVRIRAKLSAQKTPTLKVKIK